MQKTLVSERFGGAFLITYAVLSLVAIAHHPQVTVKTATVAIFAEIAALAGPDEFMHGTMIVLLLLLAFGFFVLSRVRGFDHPAVIAASLCAAVGVAGPIAAAIIDGFWIPWFGAHAASEPNQVAIGTELLVGASIFIQVATKLGFVGIGTAIAMYSLDFILERRAMLLGAYGLAAALAVIIMLSTVAVQLTPRTLLFPMALQTIWLVVTGAFLAKGQFTGAEGVPGS
jgi:hypothetical protein